VTCWTKVDLPTWRGPATLYEPARLDEPLGEDGALRALEFGLIFYSPY
jgi:hypothetical protein